MNIEIEFVPGTPGDVALIDTTNHGNQAAWFYDREAETEASRELAMELRQLGAELPKRAVTCKVKRLDGERLEPARVGFQIAVKLARAQGFTVGHLEEHLTEIEGETPARYLIGEVRRAATRYEVLVTPSGRGWAVFEVEVDGPTGSVTGRALGRAERLPDACGLAREHVMAHGARTRRRLVPRGTRSRKEVGHV